MQNRLKLLDLSRLQPMALYALGQQHFMGLSYGSLVVLSGHMEVAVLHVRAAFSKPFFPFQKKLSRFMNETHLTQTHPVRLNEAAGFASLTGTDSAPLQDQDVLGSHVAQMVGGGASQRPRSDDDYIGRFSHSSSIMSSRLTA